MKRKLTSGVLAIAVMLSLSIPTFAADCQSTAGAGCGSELLLQILLQCGSSGSCGAAANGNQLSGLLCRLLPQYCGSSQAGDAEAPNKPETPPQPETPAKPETPSQPETPTKPSTPSENAGSTASAYEREVIRLVNVERAKYGVAALQEDALLTRTARMKSQDMRDKGYFDHNSPTYGTPFQLMKSQGVTYRTAGENIAMGYRTPEAVVNAWMNSPGHRANILNASYTKLGVGYVASGNYWTQHFTG